MKILNPFSVSTATPTTIENQWGLSGPGWHRQFVGGRREAVWMGMGEAQLKLLQAYGAEPCHHILDVGCGSLRLGSKLIPALLPDHYVGLDISELVVRAGIENELLLWRETIKRQRPTFVITDRFELPPDRKFDFAIAHSVFTHLNLKQIRLCIRNVVAQLAPEGVLLASYNRANKPIEDVQYPDMTYYPTHVLRQLCEQERAQMTHVGQWGIPQNETNHQLLLEIRQGE